MNKGVKVINLSLGTPFNDPIVEFWINKVTDEGIVVVASSGNCGNSNSGTTDCFNFNGYGPGDEQYGVFNPKVYPAYYSSVISVGALNWNTSTSTFSRSSYSTYNDEVDVAVPVDRNGSGSILTKCSASSNCVTNSQGTSFAAPQVAGVAALIASSEPGLSPVEIKGRIKASTDVVGLQTQHYGTGKVNACRAVLGCGGINYPVKSYFTWYDTKNGNSSWTLLTNPDTINYIRVRLVLPGKIDDTVIIKPGDSVAQSYPNIQSGPISISAENGANVISTQRSFTSFQGSVEYPGIDATTLDSKYYFTWYDTMGGNRAWTLVGNPSENPIKVRIRIGNSILPTINQIYTINPGQTITPEFGNVQTGPVVVEGLNFATELPDTLVKFYTTQRIFTANKSSWEYAGIPASTLDSKYYFTWNDTRGGNNTWILVGNPGVSDIKVRIRVSNIINQVFTVRAGSTITPLFANIVNGPVIVEGLNFSTNLPDTSVKFYSTQRMYTAFKSSYEYSGIAESTLTNKYYLTWNDSMGGNNTWNLVGNPSTTTPVTVRIRVGNPNLPAVDQTYVIQPGTSITPMYPTFIGGPILIEAQNPSDKIFVTQRTFTKFRSSGEYAGIIGL
jgi:hypothetical protein